MICELKNCVSYLILYCNQKSAEVNKMFFE